MNSRRRVILKSSVIAACSAIALSVLLFGSRPSADASAFGPSASHTNAPGEDNCTSCHGDFAVNSGGGSVAITGVPRNYLPGHSYPIVVTTSQNSAGAYGFQMTPVDKDGEQAGGLVAQTENPARMQTITGLVGSNVRLYMEHTVDGLFTMGQFGFNSWTFTWTAPTRKVGKIGFYAAGNAANGNGNPSGDYIYTTSDASLAGTATANFDTDTTSDLAVFRPSAGNWYTLSSGGAFGAVHWGLSGDKVVPGDYDGDGTTDYAVFRPSDGNWYVFTSGGSGYTFIHWGTNGDVPVPGDYDGDGKTDLAIFRPSTGDWWLLQSTAGVGTIHWGTSADVPAQADYDGDGKTDPAVFRPSAGVWYIDQSSDGPNFVNWGLATDRLAHGDFDGDGKQDMAIFRPSTGDWWLRFSSGGSSTVHWGVSEDIPVPGDYDGDGKTDIAVFRPSQGNWYMLRSSDSQFSATHFGTNGDFPIEAGYLGDSQ